MQVNPTPADVQFIQIVLQDENNISVYFAGLVFSEYLISGQAPLIKEVNDEEPLFPTVRFSNMKSPEKVKVFIHLIIHSEISYQLV